MVQVNTTKRINEKKEERENVEEQNRYGACTYMRGSVEFSVYVVIRFMWIIHCVPKTHRTVTNTSMFESVSGQ